MGKELRRIGAPFRQPEWSALALIEAPTRVAEAHHNFVGAGAAVITTSNYAVVPYHLGDKRFAGVGHELTARAGELARSVADDTGVLVAGSLPPPFGSYRPDLFEPDRAPAVLDMIVDALAPFVDLWMPETLGSVAEIDAANAALDRLGDDTPRWISFTLDDRADFPVLQSGESIDTAAASLDATPRLAAALINCSLPEHITPALRLLRHSLGHRDDITVGAYANAFPPDPPAGYAANESINEARVDLTPERYADAVDEWLAVGATIVGGCCDITPAHIAEIRSRLGRSDTPDVSAV